MKAFKEPTMEVVKISNADVICSSGCVTGENTTEAIPLP